MTFETNVLSSALNSASYKFNWKNNFPYKQSLLDVKIG